MTLRALEENGLLETIAGSPAFTRLSKALKKSAAIYVWQGSGATQTIEEAAKNWTKGSRAIRDAESGAKASTSVAIYAPSSGRRLAQSPRKVAAPFR